LGFRRDLAEILISSSEITPDFIEVSPENWIGIGGRWGRALRAACERYPVTAHGLSLSLGSPDPLDRAHLKNLKGFLSEFNISLFSEHLAFCSCDNAHLYDLLPVPFREDAVRHVSARIKEVQHYLGRTIAIENISYYLSVGAELSEEQFLNAILEESQCTLLLDINNVFVNAHNHHYDPRAFLSALPLHKVAGVHIAGHFERDDGIIIDTHGAAVRAEVFDLLAEIYPALPARTPILIERDFNFPQPAELQREVLEIRGLLTRGLAHVA